MIFSQCLVTTLTCTVFITTFLCVNNKVEDTHHSERVTDIELHNGPLRGRFNSKYITNNSTKSHNSLRKDNLQTPFAICRKR